MNEFVKTKYLPALRSGEHDQARHRLYNEGAVCALGLAGVCMGISTKRLKANNNSTYLEIRRKLGLKGHFTLFDLNDSNEMSFPEIANYLEAHPELFRD
jgi:hypothetical protein